MSQSGERVVLGRVVRPFISHQSGGLAVIVVDAFHGGDYFHVGTFDITFQILLALRFLLGCLALGGIRRFARGL